MSFFVRGGGEKKVSFDKVRGGEKKPMRAGGLSLRSIRERNIALQGKWLWSFNREEGKLWRRVVEAR